MSHGYSANWNRNTAIVCILNEHNCGCCTVNEPPKPLGRHLLQAMLVDIRVVNI